MKWIEKRENMINKYLIILDMDETLINSYSKKDMIENYIKIENVEYEYKEFKNYYTFFRPYLEEFIDYLFNCPNIEVGIWTASEKEYAYPILKEIFKNRFDNLKHVLYRDETTVMPDGRYIKDLSKLIYPIEKTFIIDDKMESATKHPNSLIEIKPFYMYNKNDRGLKDMKELLISKFG